MLLSRSSFPCNVATPAMSTVGIQDAMIVSRRTGNNRPSSVPYCLRFQIPSWSTAVTPRPSFALRRYPPLSPLLSLSGSLRSFWRRDGGRTDGRTERGPAQQTGNVRVPSDFVAYTSLPPVRSRMRGTIAGHRRESSSAATLHPTLFVSATVLSLCLSAARKPKPRRAKRKLKTTAPRARIQRLNFISRNSTNPRSSPQLHHRQVSARCFWNYPRGFADGTSGLTIEHSATDGGWYSSESRAFFAPCFRANNLQTGSRRRRRRRRRRRSGGGRRIAPRLITRLESNVKWPVQIYDR